MSGGTMEAPFAMNWGNVENGRACDTTLDSKDLFAKKATKDDLHKSLEQLLNIQAQKCSKYMGA